MKSRFLLLGACALLLGGRGRVLAQQTANQDHLHAYKTTPVWSDEFNGSAVSPDNWAFETGGGGWGNNELEYYQAGGANTSVANGTLTITARKEWVGSSAYTSARMKTKGLQDIRFGRVEARIEMPQGNGLWPGFWMLGSNIDEAATHWPKCGEIDIVERVNQGDQASATEHWHSYQRIAGPEIKTDGGNPEHVFYPTSMAMASGGYHTYAMEWDQNSIWTWVDGVKYHEFNIKDGINSTEEFQKRFFVLLNLAVGGDMPFGWWTHVTSVDESRLPATMNVDYVRVFERADAPVASAQGIQLEAENADYADMHIGKTMKAEACSEGGENMGYIQAGNFLKFNVNFPGAGTYRLDYRVASGGTGGTISADLNGGAVALGNTTIPGTGGWQTWQTVSKTFTVATAGTYDLGIFAQTAGYNLNWIRLTAVSISNPPPPPPPTTTSLQLEAENANVTQGMTAEACSEGGQDMGYIQAGGFLTFNTIKFPTTGNYLVEYRVASGGAGGTISCDLNGGTISLGSTTIPGTGGWQTWQTVSRTVSVNAGTYNFGVYAQTAGYNLNWVRITPQGGTPPPPAFSRQLEAESANVTQGMTAEACSEGGQDMGYIQQGGFLTFNSINFPTTGTYLVEYRVASGGTGGTISCDLNGGTISLGLTTIPGTGGWQTWQTVSRTVSVNAGTYNFGVYAQTSGYNLNWIRITKQGAARGLATAVNAPPARGARPLQFYPNPVTTSFVVDGLREAGELTLRDYLGRICLHQPVEANERVDISTLPVGIYVLTVRTAEGQLVQKLVKQ